MTESYSVKFEPDLPVMLRDGVITYADVYRPDAQGKFPTLLQRTPYNKTQPLSRTGSMDAVRAAMRGYAVVVQDVRGRYSSDGEFYTFVNEINDGYDSVEWAASQEWSSGRIGMYGASYVGATQWLAAKSKPPSLAAIAPTVTASDYHEGWTWQGGAFELGFNLSWAVGQLTSANWEHLSKRLRLPTQRFDELIAAKDNLSTRFRHLPTGDIPDLAGGLAPYYYDWLAHSEYDDYWKRICIEESHHEITVPSINLGGWYDIFLGGTIRNYLGMREAGATETARKGQRLVIGPWIHGGSPTNISGEYNFGTMSASGAIDLMGRGAALLRSLPQGRRQRGRRGAAREHIRHGRQRLETRERVAPRQGAGDQVLPAQQRQGEHAQRRRPAQRRFPRRGGPRRLPVQPHRSRPVDGRSALLRPGLRAIRWPTTRGRWRRGPTCSSTRRRPWRGMLR